jgi:hypothetical protein
MTVIDDIINRLIQFFSWLFNRQWEREEILITAIVALFLLLLLLIARRKARTRIRYVPPGYVPRTTIGIRLANPAARR